ncbi:MAG TPA: hypothetical protein PKC29_00780 [Thermodesulfobacteriota bacterium]|nr:hypothetical protein [Thermodesulfobacteriota bacterium]
MKNLSLAVFTAILMVISVNASFAGNGEAGADTSNPYVNSYSFDSVFVKYVGKAEHDYKSGENKATYEWTETLYIKGGNMARETKGVTPGKEVNNLQIVDTEFAYVIDMVDKQGVKVDNASKYGKEEYEKLSVEDKLAFREHLKEKGVVTLDLPPLGKKVGTEKILGYECDVYETGENPTEENIEQAVKDRKPLPELRKTWIWRENSLPLKMLVETGDTRMEFKAVEIKEDTAIPETAFEVPEGVSVIYNEYESGVARANILNQFQLYKTGLDEPLRIKAAPPKHGISPEDLEAPSKDTGTTGGKGG